MTKSSCIISSRWIERDSLLFVYGTLRPEVRAAIAVWLGSVAAYVARARTCGRLYDLGSYPGLVAARRRREWVVGDVYAVPKRSAVLRVLDRYEAGEAGRGPPRFVRVEAPVLVATAHGEVWRRAWLYRYSRSLLFAQQRIMDGDYVAFLERRGQRAGVIEI